MSELLGCLDPDVVLHVDTTLKRHAEVLVNSGVVSAHRTGGRLSRVEVTYTSTDGDVQSVRTRTPFVSSQKAARDLAERVIPEDAKVGPMNQEGSAYVFRPDASGAAVRVKGLATKRTATLHVAERTPHGTKSVKQGSVEVFTSAEGYIPRNKQTLALVAQRLVRDTSTGRIIFAR